MEDPYLKVVIRSENTEYCYITTEYHLINEKYHAAGIITLLKDFYDENGLDKIVELFKQFLKYKGRLAPFFNILEVYIYEIYKYRLCRYRRF